MCVCLGGDIITAFRAVTPVKQRRHGKSDPGSARLGSSGPANHMVPLSVDGALKGGGGGGVGVGKAGGSKVYVWSLSCGDASARFHPNLVPNSDGIFWITGGKTNLGGRPVLCLSCCCLNLEAFAEFSRVHRR